MASKYVETILGLNFFYVKSVHFGMHNIKRFFNKSHLRVRVVVNAAS